VPLKKESINTNKSIKFSSKHDSWQDPNEFNLSCLESQETMFDLKNPNKNKNKKLRKIKSTNLFVQPKKLSSVLIPEPVEHFKQQKPVKQTFTSYFNAYPKLENEPAIQKQPKPFEKFVDIKKIDSFEDEKEIEFPKDLINKLAKDVKSDSGSSIISKKGSLDSLSPIKKITSNPKVESFQVFSKPKPLHGISKCKSNKITFIEPANNTKPQPIGLNEYENFIISKNPFHSNLKITNVKKIKLNYDKAVFSFLVWNKKNITISIHSFSYFSLQVSIRLAFFYLRAKDILKQIYNIKHQRLSLGKCCNPKIPKTDIR
jgi:hypothetical protein